MAELLIFDLDGTLIDSVGGIAASVNRTRMELGFKALPEEQIASYVGDGARKLLERSFAGEMLPVPLDDALKIMVEKYSADPLYHTFLYPGVKDGLMELYNAGWILTVVSNKPQVISEKILSGLGIREILADNIGGEAGFPLKPAPDALLYLLKKYSADPGASYVIGDNHTDLNSAANAGMRSIFCTYGIGCRAGVVADYEVDSFAGLTAYLKNINR